MPIRFDTSPENVATEPEVVIRVSSKSGDLDIYAHTDEREPMLLAFLSDTGKLYHVLLGRRDAKMLSEAGLQMKKRDSGYSICGGDEVADEVD